jgi:uncharacterized protein (DUF58 family)
MFSKKARIYILPTGFGFLFLFGAVLMIFIGAAYQNNLVNMLAFFMLSLIFVSMVQTANNLKDVVVEAIEVEGGHAGREFVVTSVLRNSGKDPRFNLETNLNKKKPRLAYENVQPLLPLSRIKLRASYSAGRRGKETTNTLTVHTTYPLGLFRSWVKIEHPSEYYIYPALKGSMPLPSGGQGQTASHLANQKGGDDFHGHRRYVIGDSFNHIDWKARARGRPLLIKEFSEGSPQALAFSYDSLSHLEPEDRLSQLAQWIDQARTRRLPYLLILPDLVIPPGHGHTHAVRCFEALATFVPRNQKEPSRAA